MKNFFRIVLANLFSSMEYRWAFVTQIGFMMLNNVFLLVIWYLFFEKFGSIAGLDFETYSLYQAMLALVFWIHFFFFMGSWDIASKIRDGGLDSELLLPGNALLRVVMGRSETSAIGDTLYGFLVFMIFYPLFSFPSFLAFLVTGVLWWIILASLVAIVQSLTFYLGDTEDFSDGVYETAFGPGMYPPQILEGFPLKFVFYSVAPAFFAVWLPVDLVRSFDWIWFAALAWFAAFMVAVAFVTFHLGLKRYESGNLMVLRK